MQVATVRPESVDRIEYVAEAVAGFQGFIRWAGSYGYELRHSHQVVQEVGEAYSEYLELSAVMSASFNFGYDSSDQSIFIAVEQEEFDWLPFLPIEEVVVSAEGGKGNIFILTAQVDLGDGDVLPPLAIQIRTDQPKLWQAFPNARDIGFMCVLVEGDGIQVHEFSTKRYPLRYVWQ